MEIMRALTLPAGWDDPVLGQAEAAKLLAQPGYVLLAVAANITGNGHLLGRAAANEAADIITLFVPSPFRRQGVARALLAAFIGHLRAEGASGLTLEVRADNAAAIALYTACGLQPVHRRVGYYPDALGSVDALVLQRLFA